MAAVDPKLNSPEVSFVAPPTPVDGERRFLIPDVSWQAYLSIAKALGTSHVRLTYLEGKVELMSPSRSHERWKKRLARLLEVAAQVYGLRLEPGGNMTFQRADLEKGLEPDDCYWVASAVSQRERPEWTGGVDPPPDLVLEVELSPPELNRMRIYAGLGVAEVWRFNGRELRVEILTDGHYQAGDSRLLPGLKAGVLVEHADQLAHPDYFEMEERFRAWLLANRPK